MPRISTLSRRQWAATAIASLGLSPYGVEVGACGHPVPVPASVRMTFVDVSSDTGSALCNYSGGNAQAVTLVDDAERLDAVRNSSQDILIASHVLEHVHNVFSTLNNWLRVLRRGGVALVIVPDACDYNRGGDHLRLITSPVHFLDEYVRPRNSHHAEHLREASLSAWGFQERLEGRQVPRRLPNHVSAAALARFVRQYRIVPHAAHLHTWTLETMRETLHLAKATFERDGTRFRLGSLARHHGPRLESDDWELRVILQKA